MWISIIGASSTGKEFVANTLKKRDFTTVSLDNSIIKTEQDFIISKLLSQFHAQNVMFDKDIFTIRTVWDSFNVMSKCYLELEKITQAEFESAERYYNTIQSLDILTPPNMVIFTRMEKKDIQNRTLLHGRSPDDREISKQIEMYEEFISNVRVPKIELDMSRRADEIIEELNFGIDSVKSMVLTQKTIWKRNMFY